MTFNDIVSRRIKARENSRAFFIVRGRAGAKTGRAGAVLQDGFPVIRFPMGRFAAAGDLVELEELGISMPA